MSIFKYLYEGVCLIIKLKLLFYKKIANHRSMLSFQVYFTTRPVARCFQETPLCGTTVKLHEPVGVVGIICPQVAPLLGFVSLFAPVVARGNCVVIVPSMSCPLPALDLYQVNLCINTLTLKVFLVMYYHVTIF